MSAIDDDLLQRYYDGELSPVEERSLQARVDADPEAQLRLKQLARLSEALRDAADEAGRSLDSDALFANITSGITKQSEGGPGSFEVITGEWVEHKKKTWMPVAVASAVAAAALFAVMSSGGGGESGGAQLAEQVEAAPEAEAVPPSEDDAPIAEPTLTASAQGSHVENVDFGNNTGTVFEIETRGISAAVVWIADESDEEEVP